MLSVVADHPVLPSPHFLGLSYGRPFLFPHAFTLCNLFTVFSVLFIFNRLD